MPRGGWRTLLSLPYSTFTDSRKAHVRDLRPPCGANAHYTAAREFCAVSHIGPRAMQHHFILSQSISSSGVYTNMSVLSSVQIKMVSMRSEKPIFASLRLSGVSPTLPLTDSCNVRLIDDGPLSSFQTVQRLLFPRLSSPGDRRCDVLGFVPAASVSGSSTFQIFRDTSNL